ncbi:MAG: type I 3-dehydroquinate dehydratase [Archaeoglobaceae archaeon]|nr:type I 3-dehydroquinate dehydratase [Archaeoglobaceae archaeon]MDW8127621.1 type I 3-dehydroquinate dehydratase [Archaeoglobaceae archaeon]
MRLVATVSNSEELKLAERADLIELRLDLGEFKEIPRGNFIVTCRRKSEGGLYDGEEEKRIEKMRFFAEKVNAELVDLEFDLPDRYFKEFNCKIIESYHNFKETPNYSFLKDLVESKRGDYFKIATLGKSEEDWRKIVKILLEYENVVAFLMGEKFSYTRIFSAYLGSPFIYCYVGTKKAPGQIELNDAAQILRLLGVRR